MPAYTANSPYTRFTEADQALMLEQQALRKAIRLQKKNPLYPHDQIMVQPPNSTPFIETGSIQASDMAINTRYLLLEFTVPNGCVGVMKNRSHWVEGAGFIEGSGALRWSVAIGDGWIYNEGNMLYSIGPDNDGAITGSGGGIVLRPNMVVRYYVTTSDPITLDASAVVLARLRGWYAAA